MSFKDIAVHVEDQNFEEEKAIGLKIWESIFLGNHVFEVASSVSGAHPSDIFSSGTM